MTQSGIFRLWALAINSEICGVEGDDAGKIRLLLNPSYRDRKILHLKRVK